jgi:PhzF family phenazine biosynthesis protein
MNLSETAFLYKKEKGYDLRWFTPAVEVDLCGHATLASAHILWEEGILDSDKPALFHTRSGLLTAVRKSDHKSDLIEMNFPSEPEEKAVPPSDLLSALAVTPKYVGRNRFDYLVEVDSEEIIRNLKPDLALLRKVQARGVIVTSAATSQKFDFVSRFFGPAAGVDEDPVTGSAHCCLGPFWKDRLGKDELVGFQASARGGIVRARVAGDRVFLGGQAVTVLRGELL